MTNGGGSIDFDVLNGFFIGENQCPDAVCDLGPGSTRKFVSGRLGAPAQSGQSELTREATAHKHDVNRAAPSGRKRLASALDLGSKSN
jgi:hypothetical protein